MIRMKFAILAGAAALAIAAGVPANAAQNSHNRGTVEGWGSSGWSSSGDDRAPGAAPDKSTSRKSATGGSSSDGTTVPEPSNLLMLAFGLAGLIAGRMVARRRKKT